ncbi:MAG: phenylalanine--tRNA ligase subunit beta [Planctomycetes bacterium GWF2_50_10]|nr:MAG: phenylalanine--tRNA ligase subunit beta [Planctomycetes bacterium GWF2_50_10]
MKISLNWLRDYVDFDLSAQQIGSLLSDRGFPFESIETVGSDTVIDFEITSNRGDCLGHIGIARELAAATGKTIKLPKIELPTSERDCATMVQVEIAEPALCGRYTARVIEGVKIGPTPDWMKTRLEAVGLRSVNNVVDATNYAMMETGQPPHAFDFAKIDGAKIVVRKGIAGERITAIDGSKCDLNPAMLVIADKSRPVALAGVMGGLDSEVSDSTTAILLEDAHFAPLTVRTTSRKLGIKSDACYRFERVVDIENIDWASQRTAHLITMVAGGLAAKGVVDAYPQKPTAKTVSLRLSRLKALLGIEVKQSQVLAVLSALGLDPQAKAEDLLTCTIPTWRNDLYREADLIEEFARLHGFDKLPIQGRICIDVVSPDERQRLLGVVRNTLNAAGFYETISVTFVDDVIAKLFSGVDRAGHLAVTDVSRKSANLLRQNLIGSLAQCFRTNLHAKNADIDLYEIADTFKPAPGEKLPLQQTMVGIISQGDLRKIRGVIEAIARMLDRDAKVEFASAQLPWASAGAQVTINSIPAGFAGIASKEVLDALDIKNTSFAGAEIDFSVLGNMQAGAKKIKPIPRFPAIDRDLSIIVDEDKRWVDIETAVGKAAPKELENVNFVGIYRGKPVAAGKKSVTLSLRFRNDEGTLTHEMVDSFQNVILQQLAQSLDAQLRTA